MPCEEWSLAWKICCQKCRGKRKKRDSHGPRSNGSVKVTSTFFASWVLAGDTARRGWLHRIRSSNLSVSMQNTPGTSLTLSPLPSQDLIRQTDKGCDQTRTAI